MVQPVHLSRSNSSSCEDRIGFCLVYGIRQPVSLRLKDASQDHLLQCTLAIVEQQNLHEGMRYGRTAVAPLSPSRQNNSEGAEMRRRLMGAVQRGSPVAGQCRALTYRGIPIQLS